MDKDKSKSSKEEKKSIHQPSNTISQNFQKKIDELHSKIEKNPKLQEMIKEGNKKQLERENLVKQRETFVSKLIKKSKYISGFFQNIGESNTYNPIYTESKSNLLKSPIWINTSISRKEYLPDSITVQNLLIDQQVFFLTESKEISASLFLAEDNIKNLILEIIELKDNEEINEDKVVLIENEIKKLLSIKKQLEVFSRIGEKGQIEIKKNDELRNKFNVTR